MISDTLLGIIIGAAITTVVGPIILLIINKFFNKNQDAAVLADNALKVANQAVIDLASAREEISSLRTEIVSQRKEMSDLLSGKRYRLIVDMIPYPDREILSTDLILT